MRPARHYQAREFAERAGVTVRTLHHYDRVGLLKPSSRTEAGYRLYGDRDLVRLEQILALKFIGFPLKEIRQLLKRDAADLPGILRRQRTMIEEKRRRLDLAVAAIQKAEQVVRSGQSADWEVFRRIIEVIHMQSNTDWMMRYYSDEARVALAKRQVPSDGIEQEQRDWAVLLKEVDAALDEDPASPKSQALADRWMKLLEGFTGGNRAVQEGLNKLYADQQNWPSTFKKPFSDEAAAFIGKVMKARKQKA
jgi:DNA-binding transcriptional MerR regulator